MNDPTLIEIDLASSGKTILANTPILYPFILLRIDGIG